MRQISTLLAVLAVALIVTSCLKREQFYGTVAGSEQRVIGRTSMGPYELEVRQQYLSDYDFWGSRDGGLRYDYFLTNSTNWPMCARFTLTGLEKYVVREKRDSFDVKIAPGAQAHVAYVRIDSGPSLSPNGNFSFC